MGDRQIGQFRVTYQAGGTTSRATFLASAASARQSRQKRFGIGRPLACLNLRFAGGADKENQAKGSSIRGARLWIARLMRSGAIWRFCCKGQQEAFIASNIVKNSRQKLSFADQMTDF